MLRSEQHVLRWRTPQLSPNSFNHACSHTLLHRAAHALFLPHQHHSLVLFVCTCLVLRVHPYELAKTVTYTCKVNYAILATHTDTQTLRHTDTQTHRQRERDRERQTQTHRDVSPVLLALRHMAITPRRLLAQNAASVLSQTNCVCRQKANPPVVAHGI